MSLLVRPRRLSSIFFYLMTKGHALIGRRVVAQESRGRRAGPPWPESGPEKATPRGQLEDRVGGQPTPAQHNKSACQLRRRQNARLGNQDHQRRRTDGRRPEQTRRPGSGAEDASNTTTGAPDPSHPPSSPASDSRCPVPSKHPPAEGLRSRPQPGWRVPAGGGRRRRRRLRESPPSSALAAGECRASEFSVLSLPF